MMRPPTTDGKGQSDFHDIDDAEIEPKRGKVDDLDQHPDSRPDTGLPGADPGSGLPGTPDDDLPERLGERIENGSSSSMTPGGTDVLPDVEVPETTM